MKKKKVTPRFSFKRRRERFDRHNSFDLNYGGERIATVATIGIGNDCKVYWYGLGQNTAQKPCNSYDEAKAECLAFAKTKLDDLKKQFTEKPE